MLKDRSSKGLASIQYSDFTPPAERVLIFLSSMAEACTASLEDGIIEVWCSTAHTRLHKLSQSALCSVPIFLKVSDQKITKNRNYWGLFPFHPIIKLVTLTELGPILFVQ